MYRHFRRRSTQYAGVAFFLLSALLVLAACGSNIGSVQSNQQADKQVLNMPNVGIKDIAVLDPALGPDSNSAQAVSMIYSGLVRADKDLKVQPDQATWTISNDNKVYTFKLKPGISFSDGTPVTAQTYIYTWTRALRPQLSSSIASFFEAAIVGSDDVASGHAKILAGVKAIDNQTLQVTLKQPTPYFLEALTTSLFNPLNQKVIEQYGDKEWPQHVAGSAVGTGPFMVKAWEHGKRMVFVPNPHYYGAKAKLSEVDMSFVENASTALKSYQSQQYDLVWNMDAQVQEAARNLPGFRRTPLLQSDLLFFDNTRAPFDKLAMRQAFAYAINKDALVKRVLKDTVTKAQTIIPPGMPGYQPDYPGIAYDKNKAKELIKSVYPDLSKVPAITFSYPTGQVSTQEATVLQQMWQDALGIQVHVNSVELSAYNDETAKHQIQFGFTQWGADYPDPYDWLALNLTTNASNNNGQWSNAEFDKTIQQAENTSGDARIKLYNKAEQIAIDNVGWLPLDHQTMAAVIPGWLHGVTLNGNGLYFGNWSDVYILQH